MKAIIPFLMITSVASAEERYSFSFVTDKDTKICFVMTLKGEDIPKIEEIRKSEFCWDVKANEASTIYVNPNPPFYKP